MNAQVPFAAFDRVEISSEGDAAVRAHGRSTYPEEACGMLLGPARGKDPRVRSVSQARPVRNLREEDREHRFLIPSEELRAAERGLAGAGLEVVGFYHSHPDHPPEPSEFDREHAWPWYVYLVLRVAEGMAQELNAFELDPERRVFQLRALRVVPVT